MYSDIVDRYRGGYDGAESQGDFSRVTVAMDWIKHADSEDVDASLSASLDSSDFSALQSGGVALKI